MTNPSARLSIPEFFEAAETILDRWLAGDRDADDLTQQAQDVAAETADPDAWFAMRYAAYLLGKSRGLIDDN
tara:strand:- start:124 stop:339 length:216 start_codon:yes stop_codon:yes gene_type:complete